MASSKKRLYAELPARLESFLKKTIQPGQRLLLGLSGGLDSSVLLHMLVSLRSQLGFELEALHVNHGISQNAAQWGRFCAELCAGYGVPIQVIRVDVPRNSGLGIEAAARDARYAVLLDTGADAVVLAHHRDDQAETLLLQLLRGAGLRGLSAMAEQIVRRGEGEQMSTILRPLLDIPRSALESYARAHDLRWIEDESNLDLAYDRNFLRHHVFPELEKRFPASRTTFARSAAHLAEASELLEEVAAEDALKWISDGRLSIEGLRSVSEARAKNLLRFWITRHTEISPTTRRLNEIYRQFLIAKADAQVTIQLEAGQVHRYRGQAWFSGAESKGFPEVIWHGESQLDLPSGRLRLNPVVGHGLSLAKIQSLGLIICSREGGERFRPDSRRPTRHLRLLFQEAGIPPWQRQILPLLFVGNTLACVPGIGLANEYEAADSEAGLDVHWEPH